MFAIQRFRPLKYIKARRPHIYDAKGKLAIRSNVLDEAVEAAEAGDGARLKRLAQAVEQAKE
jgi:hypothetical protein